MAALSDGDEEYLEASRRGAMVVDDGSDSMSERLVGRSAVITGGGLGIGRGIAEAYVQAGADVLIAELNEEAGERAASELREQYGAKVEFVRTDVADRQQVQDMISTAVEHFGRLDVLVNNAHASRQVSIMETTQEHLDLSLNTGFYPTLWLMQASYPHLKANEGAVINFASGSGLKGMPLQASYAAAKEAIRGISRVAANEWAVDGINVNIISPLAATEGVQQWMDNFPEAAEKTLANVPLHRYGHPEKDIGALAVFLASEDSSYITGQTIMADGGSIMMR